MNIEQLARKAGLRGHQEKAPGIDGAVGDWADIERFAALVRAAALEEAAKVCERQAQTKHNQACPQAVNGWWPDQVTYACALAIRALAVKPATCCAGGPQWGHAWDCPSLPG